jgi:transposase-like protein
MTPAKVRLAMAWMGKPDTKVSELCKELGVSRQTLYRQMSRQTAKVGRMARGCSPESKGTEATHSR